MYIAVCAGFINLELICAAVYKRGGTTATQMELSESQNSLAIKIEKKKERERQREKEREVIRTQAGEVLDHYF